MNKLTTQRMVKPLIITPKPCCSRGAKGVEKRKKTKAAIMPTSANRIIFRLLISNGFGRVNKVYELTTIFWIKSYKNSEL